MGTPRYLKVLRKSMICSVVVLAATNVFTSKRSCLDCTLEFAEPVDGSHVEEMQNSGDGSTTDEIMVEIGVHKSSRLYLLSQWSWHVIRDQFFGSLIACVVPIIHFLGNDTVVREFRADPNNAVAHFGEVPIDPFHSIHVSLSRCDSESRHGHH